MFEIQPYWEFSTKWHITQHQINTTKCSATGDFLCLSRRSQPRTSHVTRNTIRRQHTNNTWPWGAQAIPFFSSYYFNWSVGWFDCSAGSWTKGPEGSFFFYQIFRALFVKRTTNFKILYDQDFEVKVQANHLRVGLNSTEYSMFSSRLCPSSVYSYVKYNLLFPYICFP